MGTAWRNGGSVERLVAADPQAVYRLISDITSAGERSDECRAAAWLPEGPRAAVVGARFRGRNRSGVARWSRVCEITEAEPGRAFAFRTLPERWDPSRADSTTWRYELEARAEGTTLVRHSYEITRPPKQPFKALYSVLLPQHKDMRPAMEETLRRVADKFAGSSNASSSAR